MDMKYSYLRPLGIIIILVIGSVSNFDAICQLRSDAVDLNTVNADAGLITMSQRHDSVSWVSDTIAANRQVIAKVDYKFRPQQLIVPSALIALGAVGLNNHWLQNQNSEIRDELQGIQHQRLTFDDFIQYTPIVSYYGLSLCGVKARHDYVDRTIIFGTAAALTATSVLLTKNLSDVERPDGSASNSFPSGHTASAFMGAELLRIEYWETSRWIGVAGYTVATGTAFMRLYNNKHWLTDVITGAGIGILCARAANWLFPLMSQHIFHRKSAMPQLSYFTERNNYIGNFQGLALSITF